MTAAKTTLNKGTVPAAVGSRLELIVESLVVALRNGPYVRNARATMWDAADMIEQLSRVLREIVEEWAGAECGEPVYAQEAYAIALAQRMYLLAADALTPNARLSGPQQREEDHE